MKNVIVSAILGFLVLTTIGVSAAQLLAPDQYKPSNILGITKPQDKQIKDQTKENEIKQEEPKVESPANNIEQVKTSENVKQTTQASNTETYTNQYFPDLKIVYDKSWKMETSTEASEYDNLVTRNITLKNNDVTIQFNLTPKPTDPGACGGGGTETLETKKLKNGMARLLVRNEEDKNAPIQVVYGNLWCRGRDTNILSNINLNESKLYTKTYAQDSKVIYYMAIISFKGQENMNSNNPLVSEVDQIIGNSIFK